MVQEWSSVRFLENLKKPRQESCDLSFFKNMEFFGIMISCSSQVSQIGVSSFQIPYYNWLLFCVYMPLWKNMFLSHAQLSCHIKCGLPIMCGLPGTRGLSTTCSLLLGLDTLFLWLLNSQSINCLMFWIKLAITWVCLIY